MGFALKKIISAFLMPLSIGLILGILGLWFLYTNRFKKAKFFLTVSFLWIALISYNPFANRTIQPLETKYNEIAKADANIKYLLLLGGDFQGRAYETVELYNQNKNLIIITSGYEGRKTIPEAILNRQRLIKLGIPKEKILMLTKPRDTKEEAVYLKKIIGKKHFYLVTSAYHMPRAMALFTKMGLNPIPAPTNLLQEEDRFISAPNGYDLYKTQVAWHEYLGILWENVLEKIKSFNKTL